MNKRWIAWFLLLVTLVSCLTACGDKKQPGEEKQEPSASGQKGETKEPDIEQPKFAYKAEYTPLNLYEAGDAKIEYINYYTLSGDHLYFCADCLTGEKETYTDEFSGESYTYDIYGTKLFVMNIHDGAIREIADFQQEELPEGVQGNSYISSLTQGPDDTVLVCRNKETYTFEVPENFDPNTDDQWNYYTPLENKCSLIRYDKDGNVLSTVDVSVDNESGQSSLYELLVDSKGNIYGTDWTNYYVFDPNGEMLFQLEGTGDRMVMLQDDQVGAFVYGEEGRTLKLLDLESKGFGEEFPIDDRAWNIKPGSGDYQYLYDYNGTIFGHNKTTGEDEKLFSWLDSDVNSNNIDNFTIASDGTVTALERVHNRGDGKTSYNLITMKQVDASTLPQKEQLVVACMYVDYELRDEIIKFNKSHDSVRLVVKDYSEYATEEDYNAGITKLNTEIMSGTLPDILMTGSLPIDKYIGQGVLMDLWPLIDSDPELSREDLMTHFFDVVSKDGKLYELYSSFYIESAAGYRDIVGDGSSWTVEDLLDSMTYLEPDAMIFGQYDTKAGILSNCLSRSFSSFIDWSTGQCHFDSPEFISYLEFANQFPLEFDWENYDYEGEYESDLSRIRSGRQLLMSAYLMSFDELQYNNAMFDGKASFVGYPSANGSGNTFGTNNGLAITTGCDNVEAAWEFVRTLITEEYQSQEYFYQFPSNKKCFDKYVEQAMTPQYYTDPETGEQKEQSKGSWWIDENTTVEIYAMKQEDLDLFMELYNNTNNIMGYDSEIMNMINEEVQPYFAGQKTAQEIAALIQNKISLYVMERS